MTALAITDPAPVLSITPACTVAAAPVAARNTCPRGSRFCQDRRRPIAAAKPQVGSGVEPGSHRRTVGPLSFYDPTTSQFLSRDPLEALTRSPYGYVDGNPLDATDPAGLIGGNYCTTAMNTPECNASEEEHPIAAR